MPGYGAADDEGLRPWAWAVARLEEARTFWVATTAADGAPHLAAVWAIWFDGALWFSTGGRSRKARDLAVEPRCQVATEVGAHALVIDGVARRVTDPATVARVRSPYAARYGEGFPDPAESPLLAVAPWVVIATTDDADFVATATRWRFPEPT